MVLLSIVFLALGVVFFVVGVVGSGVGLIYVSILCALASAGVLAVAIMRSRPAAQAAAGGPKPLGERDAGAGASRPAVPTSVLAPDDEVWHAASSATGDEWDGFPIADYDDLRIDEIMPLLPELEADELEVVARRERAGANRSTLLARIQAVRSEAGRAPGAAKKAGGRAGGTTAKASKATGRTTKTAAKSKAAGTTKAAGRTTKATAATRKAAATKKKATATKKATKKATKATKATKKR